MSRPSLLPRMALFALAVLAAGSWGVVGATSPASTDAGTSPGSHPGAGWSRVAVAWVVDHQDVDDMEDDDDQDDSDAPMTAWTGTGTLPTATDPPGPARRRPDRDSSDHGLGSRCGPPPRLPPT